MTRDPYIPVKLLEEITIGISDDNEQLRAFREALQENIPVPCDGFIIDELISVIEFNYDGNVRRGITAKCRRADGTEYIVAAGEVELSPHASGADYLAAYRKWQGIALSLPRSAAGTLHRLHKIESSDLDMGGPIDLVVLSVKKTTARCSPLGSDRSITLRAADLTEVVPGEIITIVPKKQWSYAGNPYLSGVIKSTRLDIEALGLLPLRLEEQGIWDPSIFYWGDEGEPLDDRIVRVIERGPWPAFKMEQVVPGRDYNNSFSDPIEEANDHKEAGDYEEANRILMELCQADLRCLDAHAHLGNLDFDHWVAGAIRHYEVGVRIGELSLGAEFKAVLPWGHIDNRPFFRCLHGFGLCLWRLSRFDEAEEVFNRILQLNPVDNLGARILLPAIQSRERWEDFKEEYPW